MQEITLMISPLIKLDDFPSSSRILTSNIENDSNLRFFYSNSILNTNIKFKNDIKDDYLKRRNQYVFNAFVMNNKELRKMIVDSLKTEIVLLSSFSIDVLHIVKDLLNNNKKVVLGGSFCFVYSHNVIRKTLYQMGSKNLDNLIVVKGYVDKTTDLYRIIKNWKDCEIKNNKIWTIYECQDDYLLNYVKILKSLGINPGLNFSLNQSCPYQKCRYCNHKYLPDIKFFKDNNIVVNHIKNMVEKYKAKNLFITDSYCIFNDDVKYIMEKIKNNNISIFTGIHQLQNKSTILNINKYISKIFVGMESTINFTLSYIRKGYDFDDIQKAIENIFQYMSRDVEIYFNVIMDLPMYDLSQAVLNFERLKRIKENFTREGFSEFHLNPHGLTIDHTSDMIDCRFLKIDENPKNGEKYMINNIDDYPFLPNDIDIGFTRYDYRGNHIPSDFNLIDMSFLLE